MIPFQFILVLAFLLIGFIYVSRFSNLLLFRLILIVIFGLALVFAFNPDLTNVIANALGIGRGADLLLYSLFITSFMVFFGLHKRLRRIENLQTETIRAQAVLNAERIQEGSN